VFRQVRGDDLIASSRGFIRLPPEGDDPSHLHELLEIWIRPQYGFETPLLFERKLKN
jgi:hypothetical protein